MGMVLDNKVTSGDFLDYLRKLKDFSKMLGDSANEMIEQNTEIKTLVTAKFNRRASIRAALSGDVAPVKPLAGVVAFKKQVEGKWIVTDASGSKRLGGPYSAEKDADACVAKVIAATPPKKSDKLSKDIDRAKRDLISKAKSGGIYENFGQDEVRQLKDKYSIGSDYSEDGKMCMSMLNAFDEWCMNFDLSELKRASADKKPEEDKDKKKEDKEDKEDEGKEVLASIDVYNLSRKASEFTAWAFSHGGPRMRNYAHSINAGVNALVQATSASAYTAKNPASIGASNSFGTRTLADLKAFVHSLASRKLVAAHKKVLSNIMDDLATSERILNLRSNGENNG